MVARHVARLTSIRKWVLVTGMVLAGSLAALGAASPALAAEFTGEFEVFANCPLSTSELSGCLVAKTESGEVVLGKNKKAVPIEHAITLQGGFTENRETGEQTFVEPTDGAETLSKTAQTVPGGLAGLVKCNEIKEPVTKLLCELVFENKLTGVTATTELAGLIGLNEENLLTKKDTALTLPVKVKLENPLLGSECYIGSDLDPIILTLGTETPPGKVGDQTSTEKGEILTISENTLFGDTFAVPGASGCGGVASSVIDPVIDTQIGLPAATGNSATLNNTLKQATAAIVAEHEIA